MKSYIIFIFKKISHRFSDIVLSFAAGIMLAAAVLGLILPSLDYGGQYGILITVAGIFAGAVCINVLDEANIVIAAGIEAVQAEAQAQLDAYLAGN